MVSSGNTFAKTICSICYEDLKPIAEDLQSISICGHVFHELCLQQWFEYCGKKQNCPVCKQTCTDRNVGRLYFQSVGDSNNSSGLSQKLPDCEVNSEALRLEVKKFEVKVLGLTTALERQQTDLKEANEELSIWKEQAKKEATLKNEALKQKSAIQQLLHVKSEELDRSTSEGKQLQERIMALAKELAAIKLACDLNLEEEEILKLASLGNDANNKETVDVLKRSLLIRNKSYKELMAKCNILGRGEARSLSELEKAKEKIKKLESRVQELETAVEVKDNELLRASILSKKPTSKVDTENSADWKSSSTSMKESSLEDQKNSAVLKRNLNHVEDAKTESYYTRKEKKLKSSKDSGNSCSKDDRNTIAHGQGKVYLSLIDEDESEVSTSTNEFFAHENSVVEKNCLSSKAAGIDSKSETVFHEQSKTRIFSSRAVSKDDSITFPSIDMEDVPLLSDAITLDQPLLRIKRETELSVPVAQPGDCCFSGGLLGPDGTNWHLGKWCKRVQKKASTASYCTTKGPGASNGDLIVVGADGRGGRIKVLKSLNQSSADCKETSTWKKKCKSSTKTSNLQSLQIEHFFGSAG